MNLAVEGAQVDGIVFEPLSGRPRPVRILVDTGADISMIAEHIVADFQIAPTGTHHVWGVFSEDVEKRGTYALSLHVHLSDQDVLQVPELYLTSMPRAEDGVDVLLGRDLLLLMRFLYDGVKGTFSLTR